MSKLTQTEKKLVEKLRSLRNDKEYVLGVITNLEDDDERQFMLDYIDKNEDASPDDVLLLSLHIESERNGESMIIDNFFAGLEEIAKEMKAPE